MIMAFDDGSSTTLRELNDDEEGDGEKSVAHSSGSSSSASSPIACGQKIAPGFEMKASSPISAGSDLNSESSQIPFSQTSVLTTLAIPTGSTTPSPPSKTLLTLSQDSQTLRYDMSQMESDIALVLSQKLPQAEAVSVPPSPQEPTMMNKDRGDDNQVLEKDKEDADSGQDEQEDGSDLDQDGGTTTDESDVELKDDDILTGRGTGTMKRPGNLYFRQVVREASAAFHAGSSKQRRKLAIELVSKLQNSIPARRFVEQLDRSGRYAILDPDRVLSKVLQALRKSTSISRQDSQSGQYAKQDASTNESLGEASGTDCGESVPEQTVSSASNASASNNQGDQTGYKIVEIRSSGSLGIDVKPSADKKYCFVSKVHRGMSAERAGLVVGNVFVDATSGEILDQVGVAALARSRPFVVGLLPSPSAAEARITNSRSKKRRQSRVSGDRASKKQQKALELSQWKRPDGTYFLDESADMLELIRSNCEGCKHDVADGRRHHLGCPKNQVAGRTLSPASLERMREGVNVGCPTCIFELETGVRCTIAHNDNCPRTRRASCGKRKLQASPSETKSRKVPRMSLVGTSTYQRSDGTYHIDDDQDLGDVIASFCKVCNGTVTGKGSHHTYCSNGSEPVDGLAIKRMVEGVNAGCSKCTRELTTGTKRPGTHTLSCPRRPGWVKPVVAVAQTESSPGSPASTSTRSSNASNDEVRSQGRRRRPLPTPALRFVSVGGDDVITIDERLDVDEVFTALCWACSGDSECDGSMHHFYCPRNPSHRHSTELLEAMVKGVNAGCTRCTRELRCGKISGGSHTSGCPRRGARGKKLKSSPDGKVGGMKGKITAPATPKEQSALGRSRATHSRGSDVAELGAALLEISKQAGGAIMKIKTPATPGEQSAIAQSRVSYSPVSDVAEVSTALLQISKQPILRPINDLGREPSSPKVNHPFSASELFQKAHPGDSNSSANDRPEERLPDVESSKRRCERVSPQDSNCARASWQIEEYQRSNVWSQYTHPVAQINKRGVSTCIVDEEKESGTVTVAPEDKVERSQSQGSGDRLSQLVDQLESLQSESEYTEELEQGKNDGDDADDAVHDTYVLSEYERERINRIKRNEERLATLGLVQLKDNVKRGKSKRSKRDWNALITTGPRQTRSRTVTPVSAAPTSPVITTNGDLLTRLLDESIAIETVQVPFCKACKPVPGTKKCRAHHTLCPQHPHFCNSGASEKLKRARHSANLGCAKCLYLLHQGTVSGAPDHSLACEKHPEHRQYQQVPESPKTIALQPPHQGMANTNRVSNSPIKPAATPVGGQGRPAAMLPTPTTEDAEIRPVWRSCPNPWGSFVAEPRDVVLRAGLVGQQHAETLFPGKRFIEIPFASDSGYRETHSQPPHLLNLRLTRDPVATSPWGFTFANHEFGGACLVRTVDPASPAGNAVLEGTSSVVPLSEDDMIIAYDGNQVGGMTEMGLEVELDCCGAELQLVVARCTLRRNEVTPGRTLNEMLSSSRRLHWTEIDTEDTAANATTVEKQWPKVAPTEECAADPDTSSRIKDKPTSLCLEVTATKEVERKGKLTKTKSRMMINPLKPPEKQRDDTRAKDSGKPQHECDKDDDVCAGCVCGKIHRIPTPVFWLQCDECQSWYNVAYKCVKLTEDEAQDLQHWCCWACESSSEEEDETLGVGAMKQDAQSRSHSPSALALPAADSAAASKALRTIQATS